MYSRYGCRIDCILPSIWIDLEEVSDGIKGMRVEIFAHLLKHWCVDDSKVNILSFVLETKLLKKDNDLPWVWTALVGPEVNRFGCHIDGCGVF